MPPTQKHPHGPRPADRPLGATPQLERLLTRLRARLVGRVWLHGLGTLLVAVGLWLVFAFVADRMLHVPDSVRWVHLAVLLALPVLIGWRELVRHLRRVPGRAGLAVLFERARGDQGELLISAVELQQSDAPDGDPELIGRVLERADARAGALDLEGVLEERPPRRRFVAGAALALTLVAVSLAEPTYSSIFLRRLVGQDVAWPQLTWLTLSIPNLSEKAQIAKTDELIEVRVARGTDVPVLVRAEGRVPDDVTLHFGAGHKAVLGSSGDGMFRTLLRSCQEDLSFHVTGGDDRDGLPRVHVVVLDPPDVSRLAVLVEPPEYTGLPTRVVRDSDVEVPAGAELTVAVLLDPPDATGRVRLLPEDRELALEPLAFPVEADEEPREALGFRLQAAESLRYRFEIEDDSGLSNPDPGLFAVHVVPDRTPEVEVLSPGRTEFDTVPGGTLSLRVRAQDDFGVRALAYTVRAATEEQARLVSLPHQALTDAAGSSASSDPGSVGPGSVDPGLAARPGVASVALAAERLEVSSLAAPAEAGSEAPPLAGQQFLLDVRALDNRPGSAGDDGGPLEWAGDAERPAVGRSGPVRVRVLTEDEFLRRLQDRLARLRLEVSELEELQRQKSQRTRELIAALESDDPGLGAGPGELAAALSGQRRVQGDAEAVARELAAVVESVLYARVDEKAGALLESLDARLAEAPSRAFRPEVWTGLVAEWRAQASSTPGLADQLLRLLGLALDISAGSVTSATEALDGATRAVDLAGVHERLSLADRHQTAARAELEELLGLLGEWDNFQSILTLTRDILNRQKALRDRTREHARD